VQKEGGKEGKIQEFRYRDKTKVEPEMYDYTSNKLSHWNSNGKLKEILENIPEKHTIDSLQKTAILGTSHIIRNILQCETLKPERWGSPLVQEKYHEEKACDKRG
jgi:predicted Ser/Thr protein kinase